MRLYRFSPIRNKEGLLKAAEYVAEQTTELCRKAIGRELPITSLTVFSHYQNEYKLLEKLLLKMGKLHNENNGPRVELRKPIRVAENIITHLRVRKPDPYRAQAGCSDFEVEDYNRFKKLCLSRYKKNLRLIKRKEYEMIEFFDPDFDALAYVVSKSE